MPRPSRNPIGGAEAPAVHPTQFAQEVIASPVNTSVRAGAGELQQLADALGQVHAPLAEMAARNDTRARVQAHQEGLAAGLKEQNAGLVSDNPEPPPSSTVPPAYSYEYGQAYRQGVGQQLGQREHADYLTAFSAEYEKEGFDKRAFDAQWRTRSLAGVTDPVLVTEMAKSLDSASAAADSQMTVVNMKRLVEKRGAQLSAGLSQIDENTPVPQAMTLFQQVADAHKARGGSRAEAALSLFDHMAGLSMRRGGRPDLFDVFDQEVPGLGQKLTDLVPGMKDKVASEREQAHRQLDKTIHDTTFLTRTEQADQINKLTVDGTLARQGEDEAGRYLKQFVGKNGALSPEGYVHAMTQVRQQIATQQDQALVLYAMNNGGGALLEPKVAKDALKRAFDQPMGGSGMSVKQALFASIADPKKAGQLFEPAVTAIVNAHSLSKVPFADDTVKSLIDSEVLNVPVDGADLSPKFQGLSRLAAELERRSKPLYYAYFDDKARAVFSAYNRMTVEGQVPSATAYKMAYASVDPDNIKAADQLMADPAYRASLHSEVRSTMRGYFGGGNTAGILRWFPGAGLIGARPDTGSMEQSATAEGQRWKTYNPHASPDQVLAHSEQWTQANYFYEKKSNTFVQIPPALNNSETQDAVSNYLDIIRSQPGNEDFDPHLVSKGNGVYDLFFYANGIPNKVSDDVRLDSIMALRTAQKTFSPAEREQLGTLRKKITDGSASVEDLRGAEAVVSKARVSGLWPTDVQRKADELAVKATEAKSMTTLEPALRTAVGRSQFNAAAAARPNGSLSAPVATQFVQSGDLAGALTTMGEGVRTAVYKDDAGHATIGIGYNLAANVKTIQDDFRRAGIPVAQLEDIKAGKRQITIDQAMRLYQAVKPRYESLAKGVVESRYPGEWPKLGDNVKAVLTDLAYQTGDIGKFGEGLDRLFSGDLSGTGLEAKYRVKATGQYKIDERRHTLRTAMLSSTTLFQSLLTHAAKQPANAVQSQVARAGAP